MPLPCLAQYAAAKLDPYVEVGALVDRAIADVNMAADTVENQNLDLTPSDVALLYLHTRVDTVYVGWARACRCVWGGRGMPWALTVYINIVFGCDRGGPCACLCAWLWACRAGPIACTVACTCRVTRSPA